MILIMMTSDEWKNKGKRERAKVLYDALQSDEINELKDLAEAKIYVEAAITTADFILAKALKLEEKTSVNTK